MEHFVSAEDLARQADFACKVRALNENRNRKAFVYTLGCQQNEADSEKILGILRSLGYSKAKCEEEADIIIVNTCAIREHAEKRALGIIGRYKLLKDKNPDLLIGVGGCMTAQEHRLMQLKLSYSFVDFVLGPGGIYQLPELIYTKMQKGKRQFLQEETCPKIAENLPIARESNFKAWVSIMYGCNNFCTYCIVPYVRGRERSRKMQDVLAEVSDLVARGYKDITLLGQNVNSYGKDLDGTPTIADLLREISKIEGDYWVHLMTSHPKDVSSDLIDALAESPVCANVFHLPLQSGSDVMLKAMNRHYDKERYLKIVKELKEKNPNIVLSTDIIVGFPGETERDFQQTLDVLKEVRYDLVYSFIFSPRKGTPAYSMENQIPEEIAHERFERLTKLQDEITNLKNQALVGKTVTVLVDGISKNEKAYSSRTEGGKIVHFESEKDYTGQFVSVKITRADTFNLFGDLIK